MYIGPRVVSFSVDEREVSVVALTSDFIHLATVLSNHLVYRFRCSRPSVMLANSIFGSRRPMVGASRDTTPLVVSAGSWEQKSGKFLIDVVCSATEIGLLQILFP